MKFKAVVIAFAAVAIASCASGEKKKDKPSESSGSAVKEFWEDGSLKGIGPKDGGLKKGTWVLYHVGGGNKPETSQKLAEGEFVNDQQSGPWVFYHRNGAVSAKGKFIENQKTGEWVMYYETGEIFNRANYVVKETDLGTMKMKIGGIEGLKTTYYKSGKVMKEELHSAGVKNGRSQEYYENGNPKEIAMFKNNEFDGQATQWFENAKTRSEGVYSKAQKVGKWNFYHDNGQLAVKAEFALNKPEGSWTFFSRDGKVMKAGIYREGKESGKWSFYSYETGRQQVAMELSLIGGMCAGGECNVYDKGVLTGSGILLGLPKAIFGSYQDGKKIAEIEASDPPADDPVKKIEFKWSGTWKPMQKNGAWKGYFPGGRQVQFEAVYMMDKLSGKYKEYYVNGKLKAEGEYQLNKKTGDWKFYLEDGSIDEAVSGMYMMDKKMK